MNFSYWRAKILSIQLEWVKCFPVFRSLSTADQVRLCLLPGSDDIQRALVVHTAFSNLVLSEAFHTPEKYTDRIVFPDGLSGFRNLTANILRERRSVRSVMLVTISSGLIPTVVAVINNILVPIRRMKVNAV
jgi:hypothetical protein